MGLIDREALLTDWNKKLNRLIPDEDGLHPISLETVIKALGNAPTVDAEPVRRGRNENREYHEADEFICSECGLHLEDWTRYVYDENSNEEYVQEYIFKRCPECGARIVGE